MKNLTASTNNSHKYGAKIVQIGALSRLISGIQQRQHLTSDTHVHLGKISLTLRVGDVAEYLTKKSKYLIHTMIAWAFPNRLSY
jgi:hypothetical protein